MQGRGAAIAGGKGFPTFIVQGGGRSINPRLKQLEDGGGTLGCVAEGQWPGCARVAVGEQADVQRDARKPAVSLLFARSLAWAVCGWAEPPQTFRGTRVIERPYDTMT